MLGIQLEGACYYQYYLNTQISGKSRSFYSGSVSFFLGYIIFSKYPALWKFLNARENNRMEETA